MVCMRTCMCDYVPMYEIRGTCRILFSCVYVCCVFVFIREINEIAHCTQSNVDLSFLVFKILLFNLVNKVTKDLTRSLQSRSIVFRSFFFFFSYPCFIQVVWLSRDSSDLVFFFFSSLLISRLGFWLFFNKLRQDRRLCYDLWFARITRELRDRKRERERIILYIEFTRKRCFSLRARHAERLYVYRIVSRVRVGSSRIV